jgi:hypothetical protein
VRSTDRSDKLKGKIVSALLLILLASFATSSAFALQTPAIEKIVFIHYVQSPPQYVLDKWDDTNESFKLIAGGIKWEDVPVDYEVNLAGSGLETVDADEDGILDALETLEIASEEWDDGAYSSWGGVGIDLFAAPTETTYTAIGEDGINRIVWAPLDPGIIAICILWYVPSLKEIVEFDIQFNDYFAWSLDAPTETDKQMDLQNIATHEFGHASGLDDLKKPKAWELTMYAWSDYEEIKKRDLGTGDILGITTLYG